MKRITVFVGSARKKLTYYAVSHFLDGLKSFGDVEYEIVILSHYKLGTCRGCLRCFESHRLPLHKPGESRPGQIRTSQAA